jgi:hypothetical protein
MKVPTALVVYWWLHAYIAVTMYMYLYKNIIT